ANAGYRARAPSASQAHDARRAIAWPVSAAGRAAVPTDCQPPQGRPGDPSGRAEHPDGAGRGVAGPRHGTRQGRPGGHNGGAPRRRPAGTRLSRTHLLNGPKKGRTDMLTMRHVILAAAATLVFAAAPASAADIVIGLNTVNSGFMKSIAEATDTAVD